jgi:protein involved in polysaccharide export with SLBB domain
LRTRILVSRFLFCLLCLLWPGILPAAPEVAPVPLEKSRVENFFSRSVPGVGEAVRGQETIEKPSFKEKLSTQQLQQQELAFALLSAGGKTLSTSDAISFYLQLDREGRDKYLRSLAVTQRDAFLKVLGEREQHYRNDLKVAAVDRDVKQFGYDFFETTGDGFAPERLAPVGPDYIVGPGDTLVISLWGAIDASYEVTVDRSGDILLPRVGIIHLWGQNFAQAKETIRKQISQYFKEFELNVSMGALRSIQVYVVGEVQAPGTYTISSLATVLNALAAAGGPAKTGSLRKVQLVRNGDVVARIDFYDFFLSGDRSRDARLQSGDTVLVPIVGPLVGVAGDVRRPAIYELKDDESLPEVLEMAGGAVATAYLKRVQVERVESHRKKVVLDIDLSRLEGAAEEGGIALQDRDLVLVAPIAPTSASYVSLTGYVARPGRYQLIEGMRLADLLTPYDNLLPDYFPAMAQVLRLVPPDYRTQQLTVDLGKGLAGDPAQNLPLQEFDEVRLFSRAEMEEVPTITISGAVLNPGPYRYYDHMTVRDLIVTAGNVKRSAYLVEAELTRRIPTGRETRTERFLLDLQQALNGDPGQNLVLEPEDHLFVRAIPDYAKEHLVTVTGEVLFPGTYAVARGERLSSILDRAGGFAEGAYLRGAVFTRQSLKETQRERLEKLIFKQEQEITRTSSEIALGALSTEELQSAKALLESRRALVQKLREAPTEGRMVVHLTPLSVFTGSEYDIELVDGDSVTIPENPKSVSVLGQVYNPVSLTYRPGQTVSYYLAKVGGPTENANNSGMFIVRADGTVFSKPQGGLGIRWDGASHRWVAGGFDGTELYPGDTVLVPEKVARFNVLREVKDITTILYQMALGAAAIASF